MASWERFFEAMSWRHFQGASASILRMNRHYFSHDRATIFATIAPRLGRDRASIMLLELRRSLAGPAPSSPRSRLDRAAIVEFFHDRPSPSDYASSERVATIARSRGPRF